VFFIIGGDNLKSKLKHLFRKAIISVGKYEFGTYKVISGKGGVKSPAANQFNLTSVY
jgi:hypothetical protein